VVERPYTRREYGTALIVNAATDPFNAIVLAGMLIAGFALGQTTWLVPLAILVYAIGVARTFFDKEEQERVLAEARAKRKGVAAPRVDAGTLAPPIASRITAARERQARIAEAISRAELPYDEVASEVDAFVRAMEGTGARAELLYEALAETPVDEVRARLNDLAGAGDPGKEQLREALGQQLKVLERMEAQLQRFYDEMDRMTVELDTIRGNLVSVSATTEADSQRRLAEEVRGLRDELGTVAAGIDEAYKD
jgi:chromosome segregation ATPase